MPTATTAPKGTETMRQRDIVWDPAVGGKRPNTVAATPNRSSAGWDHVGPGMTRGSRRRPGIDNVGSGWKGSSKIHDKDGRRKKIERAQRKRHALIMSYYKDPAAVQQAIKTRDEIRAAMQAAFEKPVHADPATLPERIQAIGIVSEEEAKAAVEEHVGVEVLPERTEANKEISGRFGDLSDGLDDLKVGELRKMAVALGMKGGWKGPKKPELIAFIRENRP